MKFPFAKVAAICAAVLLTLSGVAWANGEEFFEDETGKPQLYYFGHVKDSHGKSLDNVLLTVSVKNVGMNFPFKNDAPGHFRSPDVGKAVQGLGKKIELGQIDVKVAKPGYKLTRAVKVPNKLGAVLLEFVMDPDTAPAK